MLIRADARVIPLVDGCVQTVVTSPPYWGLRDYGSVDQIGLEATPEAYVASLVAVFAEVWRVLKDDGTVWLNLGDSYANIGGADRRMSMKSTIGRSHGGTGDVLYHAASASFALPSRKIPSSIKAKDLIGIPWRVAFALQAAGWYLRSDIIWSKPNPMPESVTDRPTKAHEYIFLLSKQERYYYNVDAIKDVSVIGNRQRNFGPQDKRGSRNDGNYRDMWRGDSTRNKRSVWHVATQPYSGSHFATFPEKLIEPCILAGSRPGDLVFDPFCGSGTTLAVAERYGRRAVGTDLTYQGLARTRTAQRGLRFDVASQFSEARNAAAGE